VPLYNNDDDFRLFCGMMEDVAFLSVPDLTNGIHLVLASPLTVASCTFQMIGGNIGGLRLKTRRTA
jgi:hypothetical protein